MSTFLRLKFKERKTFLTLPEINRNPRKQLTKAHTEFVIERKGRKRQNDRIVRRSLQNPKNYSFFKG